MWTFLSTAILVGVGLSLFGGLCLVGGWRVWTGQEEVRR